MTDIPTTDTEVVELISLGYRRTSNKWGMVSRVDRPDWKGHMAQRHYPGDPDGLGIDWVNDLSEIYGQAEDHYRCFITRDRIQLDPMDAKKIPSSNFDPIGYVDMETEQ